MIHSKPSDYWKDIVEGSKFTKQPLKKYYLNTQKPKLVEDMLS